MKILGIDLGTYSVKVAELDTGTKGFTLNNFFEFPLSTEPHADRNLQIIEALRGLAVNYNPNKTRWIVGVPQHRVSIHFKRFPFRERPKIQKSLAFELEDDIPLDIDETVFDFKIVEYVGASADVLTVASPKEAIQELLSLCKDCGFDPEIVSVESLALNNNFQLWNATPPEISPALRNPSDEEGTGVLREQPSSNSKLRLHLGHLNSLLLVYRDSNLVATRSIFWGGADIATELARAMNIPMYEAMKLLVAKSFILMNSTGASADQIRLSHAVSSQVDLLLKEVKFTLIELRTAFNLDYVEVELTGGVSQIQNLGAYITQGLELPANANTQTLARHSTRLILNSQIEAIAPVAVGLAIEGMKRPRNPAINLRKDEFARENLSLKLFWEQWRIPAQISLSAFAAFFVYSVARDQIASSLNFSAEEKITEAGTKAAGLKGASANESNIRKYIKVQKTLLANQQALGQLDVYTSAMSILARLSEKFPAKVPADQSSSQGLDVTLFELENDDLTIKGHTANSALVPKIKQALGDMAQAKSLSDLPSEPGGFSFKLKVNRKD
jgi:general secretion pathway protein L